MLLRSSSAFFLALAFTVGWLSSVHAQEASAPSSSGEKHKDINETPPVNPLQGLFQMQPQYPSPGTTQMFPEAVPSHMGNDGNVQGRNPGTPSTTYQQPFKDTNPKPEEKIERTDNGLKGLFQMQPQYPTPGTTQMFPEAVPKFLGDDGGVQGRNPGSASNTYAVPWKDPYATTPAKSEDKTDYVKNLFQMQPQYPVAGETTMFPTATSPQFGPDGSKPAQQPGTAGELYVRTDGTQTAEIAPVMPSLPAKESGDSSKDSSESKGEASKDSDKKEGDKKDSSESGDKKDGDDNKKDSDKKDDDDKKAGEKKDDDADKKDTDKDKDSEKKDGKDVDKKAGDKKDADKKDGDKKDGDKKDGDKKDADKKDSKAAEDKKDGDKKDGEKKEEVKYLPFNPIRESINLLNANRLVESQDLLTREIKKNPKNAQAYYIRATVLVKSRQYDKAAADYNEVLKLSPTGELANRAKMGLTKIRF